MIGKFIRSDTRCSSSTRETGRRTLRLVAYVLDQPIDRAIVLQRIANTTHYVLDSKPNGQTSATALKVRVAGARNLPGGTAARWQAAMAATAIQSPHTGDPLEHLVLSFRNGENPTNRQAEAAVATVAELLDAADLQLVWSVHADTDNVHIHIVLNRVTPNDYSVRRLGGGWSHDRLAQSLALIEAEQGWDPEPDAVYRASTEGQVWHRVTGRKVRDDAGTQLTAKGDRARDRMKLQAQPKMVALRDAIVSAPNWAALHANLSVQGARFERKGSGSLIRCADTTTLKSSTISSACGFGALVARLGPYQACVDAATDDQAKVEVKRRLQVAITDVAAARAETRRLLAQQLAAVIADIRRRCKKAEAAESIVAAARREFAQATALAQASFDQERDRLRRQLLVARNSAVAPVTELPLLFSAATLPDRVVTVVHGYVAEPVATGVAYHRPSAASAFTDHRWYVSAPARAADRDLVTAMQLAAARWHVVSVAGSPQQVARSLALARLHGIPVRCRGSADPVKVVPARVVEVLPSRAVDRQLLVYISPAMLPELRDKVAAMGFEIGQRGAVRFDRERRTWRIATEALADADVDSLTRGLAAYMTDDARRVVQAGRDAAPREASATHKSNAGPTPPVGQSPERPGAIPAPAQPSVPRGFSRPTVSYQARVHAAAVVQARLRSNKSRAPLGNGTGR